MEYNGVYGISVANVCMYVRPGLVLSRLPLKKKFGLHYYVICCVVETKLVMYCRRILNLAFSTEFIS